MSKNFPPYVDWARSNAGASGVPPGPQVALVYATLAQVEVSQRQAAALERIIDMLMINETAIRECAVALNMLVYDLSPEHRITGASTDDLPLPYHK